MAGTLNCYVCNEKLEAPEEDDAVDFHSLFLLYLFGEAEE